MSTVLIYSGLFQSFFLCFSIFEGYIDILLNSEIVSSGVSSLLVSPWKAFFVSLAAFRILICLLTLRIYFCMLSTLSIRALSILFIVVLHFWFDIFNIPAISASSSDASSLFKPCCVFLNFCLLVRLVIFLWQLGVIYWVKGTAANRPLVMW